jgi:hypothetical protein
VGTVTFRYLSRCGTQVAAMDIRAVLLIGGIAPEAGSSPESVGGVPIAYLDTLGVPVVERVLCRLGHFGIRNTTVISDITPGVAPFAHSAGLEHHVHCIEANGDQFWDDAEEVFQRHAAEGAELIVALRVGPYVELDYEEMIQHHLDEHCTVSMAVDEDGFSLEIFVLDTAGRLDARELFQSHLQRMRRECKPFPVKGYVNRLQNAADLRRLGIDGLLGRNAVRPHGNEVKPGVFVGRGARIHHKARVVAPAFIGARAKIHASALITRGSVLEHHTEVDCGTVVENSTLLPYTRLGAGLDVMHSVVGFRRLAHLVRNVEVEISDKKIVDMVPLSAVSRLAGSTAALFAFLPKQIYRGFQAASHRKESASSPECQELGQPVLDAPALESPASGAESSEFPSNLAVVRRYGDH